MVQRALVEPEMSVAQVAAMHAGLVQYLLEQVNQIVLDTPNGRGKGIFWWEPAVSRRGSRSFFDEEGNVLPVIHVFDKYTRR